MICKLCPVQGCAEVFWCLGLGATAWFYTPYQILILKNVKIQAQQNTCPNSCHVQKHYATKALPLVRIKKQKKLSESGTTLHNNSKALGMLWKKFCMAISSRKKLKYLSDAGALLKRTWYILNGIVLPWCWNVLTALNRVHSDKICVMFWSFLQELKAKNLSMIALLQTLQ